MIALKDMKDAILDKLRKQLDEPIESERQVVYILVEIRKFLELTGQKNDYFALNFYASWAVHPWMKREGARNILRRFSNFHKAVMEQRSDAAKPLRQEIMETIAAAKFNRDLDTFIVEHQLPDQISRLHGWIAFLHYYSLVIEDCPLVFSIEQPLLCARCRATVKEQEED